MRSGSVFSQLFTDMFTLALILLISPTWGLYTSEDDVVDLTSTNFDRVLKDDSLWLVEFYAPWCGHCKSLAPAWKQVATALKGVVKVGAVNADSDKSLAAKYKIEGFPTLYIFGDDKSNPKPMQAGRTTQQLIDEAMRQLKSLVDARVGGKSSSGSSASSSVVEVTDSNFKEIVLDSQEPWLVEFYAPWCGHCQSLKPHWEKAAKRLKGTVNVAALDATVNTQTASAYGVGGFPTIKFFPAGSKSGSPIDYDAGRTADDIVSWASNQVEILVPPPELKEITSEKVLKESCMDHTICIITVLPMLYDCQAECRNEYLALIRDLGATYKRNKWGWLWTEALKHPALEEALDVGGFGYPAMVALSGSKLQRTTMRGAFNKAGLNEFLASLSVRGMPLFPVPSLPKVETVEPWDGKDAPPIEEDDLMKTDL